MATDIPAMIIVLIPVPNHTMNKGARADFGRLFRITQYGSKIAESLSEYQSQVATSKLIMNTRKKLRMVSKRVYPI